MKTKHTNPESGLPIRPEQLGTENTAYQMPDGSWTSEFRIRGFRSIQPGFATEQEALDDARRRADAFQREDKRQRIDFARRQANRQLSTQDLLALLRTEAPRFYELAEVVGHWVWIQFTEKQPPQVTSVLAEFGFHWNNKRQTWQHPCGHLTQGTPNDPRAKYGSHFAADAQPA